MHILLVQTGWEEIFFFRTLRGLSISLFIGIIASTFSALIALFFGVLSVFGGKKIDTVITWWIDLMMGLPTSFIINCPFYGSRQRIKRELSLVLH